MSDLGPLRIWEEPAIRGALSWYLEVAENQRPAKFRIAARLSLLRLLPVQAPRMRFRAELDQLTPIFVARWQAIRASAAARRRGRADASSSGPLTRYRARGSFADRRDRCCVASPPKRADLANEPKLHRASQSDRVEHCGLREIAIRQLANEAGLHHLEKDARHTPLGAVGIDKIALCSATCLRSSRDMAPCSFSLRMSKSPSGCCACCCWTSSAWGCWKWASGWAC